MPVTFSEDFDSRPATWGTDKSNLDLKWSLIGTEDDSTVIAVIEAGLPAFHQGLILRNYDYDPQGGGVWKVVAHYESYSPRVLEVGQFSYSFDTAGGTGHITNSKATIQKYAKAGKTAPDCKGAIGVEGDGDVKGVDITIPVFNFKETHYLPVGNLTMEYKLTLARLTGRVNNATFKGLLAGECLFMGAQGSQRNQDDFELTFNFSVQPNGTSIVVGEITGIAKKGWEYLWVMYKEEVNQKVKVKTPWAVYVEKVYEYDDFSLLGIGT